MTEFNDLPCGCLEIYHDRIYHHTHQPYTCTEDHGGYKTHLEEAPHAPKRTEQETQLSLF